MNSLVVSTVAASGRHAQMSVRPPSTMPAEASRSGLRADLQVLGWRTNSPSPGTLTIMPSPFRISRARAATRCETW
jgi:hypothetical protein